jgi:uncharacterized protein (TIGR03083 family)
MGGDDVRATAAVCRAFLAGTLGRDWTAPIPGMSWTVAEAVAHVAQGLLWYAVDLSAGPRELRTTELRVRPDSPPADLLTTIDAHAAVLAATIDAAPADARGWEPWGLPDPDGFAAVACDELLIHTDDAARGLGLAFTPPAAQAEATLRRLFPGRRPTPSPAVTPEVIPDVIPGPRCGGPTAAPTCPASGARRTGAGTAPPWPNGTAPTRPGEAGPCPGPT